MAPLTEDPNREALKGGTGTVKDEASLRSQVAQAESLFGVSLFPKGDPCAEGLLSNPSLTWSKFKELYPDRAKAYLSALREMAREKRATESGEPYQRKESPQNEALVIRLQAMNNLRDYVERAERGDPALGKFHPHQITTLRKIYEFLERGGTHGYVRLPTGSGKTRIFVALAEGMGIACVVTVPNQNLVGQTQTGGFEKWAPEKAKEVGLFYQHDHCTDRPITVTTYQSLGNLDDHLEKEGRKIPLVILDEVHRGLTEDRQKNINGIPGVQIYIGFSATPDFSDEKCASKYYPTEIHKITLPEGIAMGINCGIVVHAVHTRSDLSQVKMARGDYDEKSLEAALDLEERNQAVIKLMQGPHSNEKAAAFCCSVNHAKSLAEKLNAEGIKAAAVWGEMDKELGKGAYDKIMADYEAGKIQVICSKDKLTEGWDSPQTSVAFMLQPTTSVVKKEQWLGRVARNVYDDNGEPLPKIATVYEFFDKGPRGVLSTDVLGNAVVLPESEIRIMSEGENLAEKLLERKEMCQIDGLDVIVNPEELMRLANDTVRAGVGLFKPTKSEVVQFLKRTAFLPVETALETPIVLDGEEEPRTGREIVEGIFRVKGVPTPEFIDEGTFAQIAEEYFKSRSKSGEKSSELVLYEGIREQVRKIRELQFTPREHTESIASNLLEERILGTFAARSSVPTYGEFQALNLGDGLSGRTYLLSQGIRDLEGYLVFAERCAPHLLVTAADKIGLRTRCEAEQRPESIDPFNVELVIQKADPNVVVRVLRTLKDLDPERRAKAEVSLKPQSPAIVTVSEFLAGMRIHPNLNGGIKSEALRGRAVGFALDEDTLFHLARYAYGEQSFAKGFNKVTLKSDKFLREWKESGKPEAVPV